MSQIFTPQEVAYIIDIGLSNTNKTSDLLFKALELSDHNKALIEANRKLTEANRMLNKRLNMAMVDASYAKERAGNNITDEDILSNIMLKPTNDPIRLKKMLIHLYEQLEHYKSRNRQLKRIDSAIESLDSEFCQLRPYIDSCYDRLEKLKSERISD